MTFGRLGSLGRGFGRMGSGGKARGIIPGVISAGGGSYVWTGQDATLTVTAQRSVAADAGSYAWTGDDMVPLRDIFVTASAGSYTWTGQDATLTKSGGAWTPASLPNLLVWLDASDSSSVIRSGANVSAWNDKSGNGNNFTATNNPQYSATGFNTSYPGITTASASSNYFKSSSITLNSANLSVFLVLYVASAQANKGVVALLGSGQSAEWNNNASFLIDPETGTNFRLFSNSGSYQNSVAGVSAPHAIGWVFDGTNGTGYLDGSANTPASKTGAFGNTSAIIALANRLTTGGAVTGDYVNATYAEVIITSSALGGTDLTDLDAYFVAKWGTP